MPVEDDREAWRRLARRAGEIAEAARHDPYDVHLTEAMHALAREAHERCRSAGSAIADDEARDVRAAMHAAIGEAWLALLGSEQALAEFDSALESLGSDGAALPAGAAVAAHAWCGRGKCLSALRRSAEAVAALDTAIGWYATRGDLTDESQQSLFSQALHTLAMARAEAGDLEQAVVTTVQAVQWRRRLVEREPERYRLALSRSLRNLGDGLIALGRRDEALPVRAEMLQLRREQWRASPSVAAAVALAQANETMSRERNDGVAHTEDAPALALAAVALYRELVARNPRVFGRDLAMALCSLCAALADAGRPADARAAWQEAREAGRVAIDGGHHDGVDAELAKRLHLLDAKLNASAQGLRTRAIEACEEAQRLTAAGAHLEALEAAQSGVAIARTLCACSTDAGRDVLAWGLNVLGLRLNAMGRHNDALRTFQESLALCRELAARDRGAFLSYVAVSLHNTGDSLGQAGRHGEALRALEEALALRRELAAPDDDAHLSELAASLDTLGNRLGRVSDHADALQATAQAVGLYRELASRDRAASVPGLATALHNVSIRLSEVARHAEAVQAAAEAVALRRELAARDSESFLPSLATSLYNLGNRHFHAGQRIEALRAAEEAVELYRELAARDRDRFSSDLACSLFAKGFNLASSRRSGDALEAYAESVSVLRQLAQPSLDFDLPQLGRSLNNLSLTLSELGRRQEALRAIEQAVDVRRGLVDHDRQAFGPDLAESLHNLGNALSDCGRHDEALPAARESVALARELVARDRARGLPYLMQSINNLAHRLDEVGRDSDSLLAAQEAVQLGRELADRDRPRFLHKLAVSLVNLGIRLTGAGRRTEAVGAAEAAVELYRELQLDPTSQLYDDFVASRYQLGLRLADNGMRREAQTALRGCAESLLLTQPTYPRPWATMARGLSGLLGAPEDLRHWHLPALRQLTDHRELAWDSEHAATLLALQADIAAQVWRLLSSLSPADGDLLDEAVAALVAALQSPDLSRWLEVRGSGAGPLARLAELKREVIEAEQLLHALRTGSNGGTAGAGRAALASAGTERAAAASGDIESQAAKAQALRRAFRVERARLVADDPQFAAVFEPLGPPALRALARHAQGSALLCILDLGASEPRGSPSERGRTVAALLHANGRPTQLLDFAGAWEVALQSGDYQPAEHGASRRGPLRSARARADGPGSTGSAAPPIAAVLAPRMASSFWTPLQRALQDSGVAVDTLHVCLHGAAQQLPLALRADGDCVGVHVVAWPGLPYLRRAAASTPSPAADDERERGPWLVGHDCAWGSEQPLPMVAAEAALLRSLVEGHGRSVQRIDPARVHGGASALVACCHGGAERAQFDHALHLGPEPLTVRRILQRHIGPPLALLPACYAGRTDEDAAGNALGVAAAFMLSGTKVVVASSKAVPDLLQPWLSTLMVWHAMQGRAHHAAALIAREQFARLEFPAAYRSWLQGALPEALATIQPGGEEDRSIRGPRAQLALEAVAQCWPWEGETRHLFGADPRLRAQATRSVVDGILKPRDGERGAVALAAEARDVAAFVFVYGVD